jgi:hypothetical protein
VTPASSWSLKDLAARVDEGEPIDWDQETQQAPDAESRQVVGGFRLLAEIRDGLRDPDRATPAEPQPARPDVSGTPWGRLTVFEVVGRGAFGTVHRAVDQFNRNVALKLLDPAIDVSALKDRILDEGRLLARVQHSNIVTVYGADESDGRVGLWMEFIEGRTLAAEVEARGHLSGEEATIIGLTLCSTLVAIHREGVVHADVKAQNVMRASGGRIVLMDFGAGQRLVTADATRLAGTPLYLSPERLAGGPLTAACDIYSLGVLLYFLVTGTYPVDGTTREDVEQAHRTGTRILLRDRRSDLPTGFVTAVEDALAPDPARRHKTAGAFEEALSRAVSPRPLLTGLTPAPAPRRWYGWRGTWAAALVVGIALSAVGIKRFADRDQPTSGSRPTAVPVAAPESTGYSMHAVFYRIGRESREALAGGARLTTDDLLELEITLSRDIYVYVINEDEQHNVSLLFPVPGGELQNPIRGGQVHLLPGRIAGDVRPWQVSSAGGREHFFVLVSPRREPEIDAAVARLAPVSGSDASLSAKATPPAGGLRGVQRLGPAQPGPSTADTPWHRKVRPLLAGIERMDGVSVRQLSFENPPRPR